MFDGTFVARVLGKKLEFTLKQWRALHITFVKSSLILTHGLPSTEAILMTILRALLFSFPPLEAVLKSLVKKVPIPNETGRWMNNV